MIDENTSLLEVAVRVSMALEAHGVIAVLGGGGAVSCYTQNQYMSADLDFITSERNSTLEPILAPLGFVPRASGAVRGKDFHHPRSEYFLEFPPGPLTLGDRYISEQETDRLETAFGLLRIITPTQSFIDRLAWFVHGKDLQSRDQSVLLATHQKIDWPLVDAWARHEDVSRSIITNIRQDAARRVVR